MASVHVGGFSGGSTPARAQRLAPQVETGGFRKPIGFQGDTPLTTAGPVPRLGAFDLPARPGQTNGAGGSRGTSGAVRSAAFGNGIASPGGESPSPNSGPLGQVHQGGFSDQQPVAAARPAQAQPPGTTLKPVEILSKPHPIYTEEGRRLHIQGEVTVQVLFGASGELRVLRVVKGLGHGLDEAALRAAVGIRFEPARRGGLPVDTVATLHIVFQLAN